MLEKRIKNSLQSICEETGMKTFCYRSKKDQKILSRKWSRLSSIDQTSKFIFHYMILGNGELITFF